MYGLKPLYCLTCIKVYLYYYYLYYFHSYNIIMILCNFIIIYIIFIIYYVIWFISYFGTSEGSGDEQIDIPKGFYNWKVFILISFFLFQKVIFQTHKSMKVHYIEWLLFRRVVLPKFFLFPSHYSKVIDSESYYSKRFLSQRVTILKGFFSFFFIPKSQSR